MNTNEETFLLKKLHPGLSNGKEINNTDTDNSTTKKEESGDNVDQSITKSFEKNQDGIDENKETVENEILTTQIKDTNINDSFTDTQFEKLDILMNLDTNTQDEAINENGFIADDLSDKVSCFLIKTNLDRYFSRTPLFLRIYCTMIFSGVFFWEEK